MMASVSGLSALALLLLWTKVTVITAICEGTETFEKVTGVTLLAARQTPLYSASEGPVTGECSNRCRASAACPAFVVNYDRSTCYRLDLNSLGRARLLNAVNGHVAYFERICLKAPACGQTWVFERLPGQELVGLDDLVLERVTSRVQCQEYCLLNHQMPCRSAEYVPERALCRLSASSRRTAPLSLRAAPDTDYLENQCVSHASSSGCKLDELSNVQMAYTDFQLTTTSREKCRLACDTTSVFSCRAFTFIPSRALCRLTSEDTASVGQQALVPAPGATFYQSAHCHELELLCSVDRMVLRLHTSAPFRGRVFALDAPAACEVRGTGQLTTEATFHYADGRCGVVQEVPGAFTTLVVVQQHNMIQRRGDRAIKLLCSYEAVDQTVSNGFTLLVDRIDAGTAGLLTSSVNATAPTPRVSLHVRDRDGADVTAATLGEQLFLSLEMDDGTIFGMLPRNLLARGGSTGESILLMDERGCPTDESIIQAFGSDGRARTRLVAPFEAFKFAEDPVVRFQVTVQFCLDRCPPTPCSVGVRRAPGGRRGRRALSASEAPVNAQMLNQATPLQREIVVEGASARDFAEPRVPLPGLRDSRAVDLLCAGKGAVVASVAAAVFLQAVILVVCCGCLYWRRRSKLLDTLPSSSTLCSSGSRHRLGPLEPTRPSTLRALRSLTQRH